jgi:hypothetical protein
MKKNGTVILCILVSITLIESAFAVCAVESNVYTSCKPGYYYFQKGCVRCPVAAQDLNGNDVYGTTPDKNADLITSCYLPAGTYKDDTGTFTVSDSCPYVVSL